MIVSNGECVGWASCIHNCIPAEAGRRSGYGSYASTGKRARLRAAAVAVRYGDSAWIADGSEIGSRLERDAHGGGRSRRKRTAASGGQRIDSRRRGGNAGNGGGG